MNARQLYLAWLRTTAPTVYANALRRATGQHRSLGGLADDLVNKAFAPDLHHSFLGDDTDLSNIDTGALDMGNPAVSIDTSSFDLTTLPSFDTGSVAAPTPVSIEGGSATGISANVSQSTPSQNPAAPNSMFNSIATAVTALGVGVLNASNQSKLIALNTTRAQQGLPPVNAAGQVVGTTGLATTSPALLAFEKSISGASGSSMLPILGIGLVALFFLTRKKAA